MIIQLSVFSFQFSVLPLQRTIFNCHSERSEESGTKSFALRAQDDKKQGFIMLLLIFAMMFFVTTTAFALELPENLKEYFKDSVSSATGSSEGVGPTEKPKVTEGVDIGRRETNEYDFTDESMVALMQKAWQALNAKDKTATLAYTDRCIELYSEKARKEQALLKDFAKSGSEAKNEYLNNICAAYFIRGEMYKYNKNWNKSKDNYRIAVSDYYFGQYWDPRGWWWKPAQISKDEIEKIDSGYYEKN